MLENPMSGRQARNFTTRVPKILDLKSSSEQIFSENWRWVPLHYGEDEEDDDEDVCYFLGVPAYEAINSM